MDVPSKDCSPFLLESEEGTSAYTHLFACISEEDDSFTVQIRLSNTAKADNTAWGEEVTDCFETASTLIASLAAEFSIPREHIEIEIRMNKSSDGTRH
jgi:hypothetical protein